jgi:hypothetical protein
MGQIVLRPLHDHRSATPVTGHRLCSAGGLVMRPRLVNAPHDRVRTVLRLGEHRRPSSEIVRGAGTPSLGDGDRALIKPRNDPQASETDFAVAMQDEPPRIPIS